MTGNDVGGSPQQHLDSERPNSGADDVDGNERRFRRERRDSTSSHRSRRSSKSRSKSTTVNGAEETAYGPEFLRALASGRSSVVAGEESPFDVIAGADALEFARRFVREQEEIPPHLPGPPSDAPHSSADSHAHTPGTLSDSHAHSRRHPPPVVFALPRSAAGDAGRKVVDFYMSWRGKTKTHRLKGEARRTGFLDSEFRRVRETIDGEWKRASRALKGGRDDEEGEGQEGGSSALARAPTDPQHPPRLPPLLAAYAQEEQSKFEGTRTPAPPAQRTVSDPLPPPSSFPINTERPPMGGHRGSVDSLTSVTSIPLLGLVRGVPVGNRVPLRVTNPGDRLSISSTIDLDVETPKARLPKSSPLRDGVAFDDTPDVDGPEAGGAQTHMVALPGRAGSDSSASSGSSRRSKRKGRREKEEGEGGKEKEKEKEKEKILIVLLDEKEGKKPPGPEEGGTWHGLEHRLSMRSSQRPPPPTANHSSPWMGPLAHSDEDVTFITTPDPSDSDSSDDSNADLNWGRRPGAPMPIKSLLSKMGYLAPEARASTPSPSYASYAPLPTPSPSYAPYAPLPTPYNSPYTASVAAAYASPYIAPQHTPLSPYRQIQAQGPPSRPQTPPAPSIYAPSGTPPQQALPWTASPAGYASPAPPAAYASPYQPAGTLYPPLYRPAPASPAAGYGTPPQPPPLYYYG